MDETMTNKLLLARKQIDAAVVEIENVRDNIQSNIDEADLDADVDQEAEEVSELDGALSCIEEALGYLPTAPIPSTSLPQE